MSDRYDADPGHVSPGCANCFRVGHNWRACPDGDGPAQFTRPAYEPAETTPGLVGALNNAIAKHRIKTNEFNTAILPSEIVPTSWE